MFDRIAGRYDLLNRIISFRFDGYWRRQVIHNALTRPRPSVLDIGTGTGDLIFDAAKAAHGQGRFVGLDFSRQMLNLASTKRLHSSHGECIDLTLASAMASPFKPDVFDSVMTAFVLRNVSNLMALFDESFRVLKPGGRFVSLDMFPPAATWFSPIYSIYFHCIMPRIGGFFAGDREAYQYLSRSVRHFHAPEKISEMIAGAGLVRVELRKFMGGAVCMHTAEKPFTPPARA